MLLSYNYTFKQTERFNSNVRWVETLIIIDTVIRFHDNAHNTTEMTLIHFW